MRIVLCLIVALSLQGATCVAFAYEHQNSLVDFEEYAVTAGESPGAPLGPHGVPVDSRNENKPYFLLFSAEWCHWCHEFAEHVLTRKDVAAYLNRNFVNVFIDVDVHTSAYTRYHATGLPYSVFLNPDGTLYYKYSGMLYADDFLDVIKEVAAKAGAGKYAIGMEPSRAGYTPPETLDVSRLEAMPGAFIRGVLDNFDPREYGLGKGQKSIQPRTFLYLLENADTHNREQAVRRITQTLERAIERIYDPVEGGFFRYAEKRNWQIPHYEKFSDLNAGIILLLYKLNRISPSPRLKQAADATLAYLNSTLFDADSGVFLSFQVADTNYYFLSKEHRKTAPGPKVMDKVFTDRLASTLGYLIQVTEYTEDRELENNLRQSLDFLAGMVMRDAGMNRYYAPADGQWHARSGLSDYARVAGLFTDAAAHYADARYSAVAAKVVRSAISEFYDEEKKILVDPGVDSGNSVEYLMELNGLMARSILELGTRPGSPRPALAESLITHYSLIGEVLEDRIWEAVEWDFTEGYVPYLRALEKYFSVEFTDGID